MNPKCFRALFTLICLLMGVAGVAASPLVLNVPANTVTASATSTNGAVVFFTVFATGGCSPPPYLSASPPSGTTFPLGATTVTATAWDDCGNRTNATFLVRVDPVPLVLGAPTNTVIASATSTNGAVVFFTVFASGGCSPPPYLSASPPSGSTFPLGATTVTATAWDDCGNRTNATFDVIVSPARPALGIHRTFNLSAIQIRWNELSSATGSPTDPPMFGLEVLAGGTAFVPAAWTTYTNGFIRRINGDLLARDQIADVMLYRLNNTVTNPLFIPSATTLGAALVTSYSATLTGTATPIVDNTIYWFQYGSDTNYGLTTLTNGLLTDTNAATLSAAIAGLQPLLTYHFQLVVSDDDGVQYGGDQSFTSGGPPPTVTTLAASTNTPCIDCAPKLAMNGAVNGNGQPIAAYFEYGLTTAYGSDTRFAQFYSYNNLYSLQTYSFDVNPLRLLPGATYHYRMVAFNQAGEGLGGDITFVTPP